MKMIGRYNGIKCEACRLEDKARKKSKQEKRLVKRRWKRKETVNWKEDAHDRTLGKEPS